MQACIQRRFATTTTKRSPHEVRTAIASVQPTKNAGSSPTEMYVYEYDEPAIYAIRTVRSQSRESRRPRDEVCTGWRAANSA